MRLSTFGSVYVISLIGLSPPTIQPAFTPAAGTYFNIIVTPDKNVFKIPGLSLQAAIVKAG